MGVAVVPSSAPTITIVDKNNNILVSAAATTARTNLPGVYEYTYSGLPSLDPVGTFRTTDTTVDQQDLYSYTQESVVTYQNTVLGSGNDYTTADLAFQDISEGNYSSSDYPQMATFITSASRLIDAELGRWPGFFTPSTDEVTRYYDGSGCEEQDIDEFVSITTVSMIPTDDRSSTNYVDLASNEWFAYPFNYSENGKPITQIIIEPTVSQFGSWYPFRKAIKIIGIAGYSATLDPRISQACKMQSVRWFMRAKQGYQDTGASVDIGQITVKGSLELDPDVRQLLYPFKLELG